MGNQYYGILIDRVDDVTFIDFNLFPIGFNILIHPRGFKIGIDIMPLHLNVGIQSSKWFNI